MFWETAAVDAPGGTLVVRRGNTRELARLPRLAFLVDGRMAVRLRPGEAARLPVPAGAHTACARTGWLRSARIDVWLSPGEEIEIGVSFRPAGALMPMVLCALTDCPDEFEPPLIGPR